MVYGLPRVSLDARGVAVKFVSMLPLDSLDMRSLRLSEDEGVALTRTNTVKPTVPDNYVQSEDEEAVRRLKRKK